MDRIEIMIRTNSHKIGTKMVHQASMDITKRIDRSLRFISILELIAKIIYPFNHLHISQMVTRSMIKLNLKVMRITLTMSHNFN